MAGMKGYLNDIEDLVIEAFDKGARNEEDVVAFVKTNMEANEDDILVVAREFFEFIRYVADDRQEKTSTDFFDIPDDKYWC